MVARMGNSYSILLGNKISKQLEIYALRSHWLYSIQFFEMIWFTWHILYCTCRFLYRNQSVCPPLVTLCHSQTPTVDIAHRCHDPFESVGEYIASHLRRVQGTHLIKAVTLVCRNLPLRRRLFILQQNLPSGTAPPLRKASTQPNKCIGMLTKLECLSSTAMTWTRRWTTITQIPRLEIFAQFFDSTRWNTHQTVV